MKFELTKAFGEMGYTVTDKAPDTFIHLFGYPVQVPSDTYNIIWIYSHPDKINPQILTQYDKIFCLSEKFAQKLITMGFEAEVMIGASSKMPIETKIKRDILFIGNARPELPYGREIIRALGNTPYNLQVWGARWDKILPQKYYGGEYVDYHSLAELYASSLITLNDHHEDMRREEFVAVKIFDILASGGFCISDKNPGIDKIFGNTVPQYESPEHLISLIDFYITHPDERAKLMSKGREIALSHTWQNRAQQFLKGVEIAKLEAKRGATSCSSSIRKQTSVSNCITGEQIKLQERKIFYIDDFNPTNSNFYWLKAFQKYGEVATFDIVREDVRLLKNRILKFCPQHIHIGGSVKDYMVLLDLLSELKNKLNSSISAFYRDAKYSPYHLRLSKIADYIYVSNMTHIEIADAMGFKNFKYMPCPTDTDVFNYQKYVKEYDLVFIGNNNQQERLPILKKLAKSFALKVFGEGWENSGLDYNGAVYGKEFSKICNKAKICIGIIDPKWIKLKAYFSNRLINTLATRSFFIQPYTPGLEKVFTNKKHLVWYINENELFELIRYYLQHEDEREKIAEEGQREVYEKYTYEKSVEMILQGASKPQTIRLHLGCGDTILNEYINIDKYNPQADRIMDVTELDYSDNSVSEIFTSHMVEHLTYPEFMKALKEWKRVLKENGILIIRRPNFETHLRNWLNSDYRTRWGERNDGVNVILGVQERGPGYANRNVFTTERLKDLVGMAGFEVIECHSCTTREGDIPNSDIFLKARKIRCDNLDEEWQNILIDEIVKGGKRFTLEWYKNHTITNELLNSGVLKGKVIDLGCGS